MVTSIRTHTTAALCAVACVVLAGAAEAQRIGWVGGHSSKVRVPDDMAREPLDIAKTAEAGGDLDRALSVYQDILDRMSDKLAPSVLAPRSGKETDHILPDDRFVGVRDHVAILIRAIPDGVARYREREGPRAAAELERALAARDEDALRLVITRFELTEAGPRALAALADILFQTDRIAEARLCADRLAALATGAPEMRPYFAHATLRAATARAALGDHAALRDLAGMAQNGDGSMAVRWKGTERPLKEILDELAAAAGAPPAPAPDKTLDAFAKSTWQTQRFARPSERAGAWEVTYRFGAHIVGDPLTSDYPVIPVLTDSAVYTCDGLRVEGLNLASGAPLWPAIQAPVGFQGTRQMNLLHEVVLDQNVLYACLEDEPDIKSDPSQQVHGFRPRETIAVRKLYAIDATTGDVLWTHADSNLGRTPDERTFFDLISVNTAPLVIGDKVFVGASYYLGGFRQWLCAFHRDTGRLAWRTYIGQGQAELNMFGNPVREAVPGYVGESQGLVVYSTNIGVVAAVDAVTGTPRWVTAYDQELVPSSDGQQTVSRAPGWAVRRPIFYAGRAIIAPCDSYHVYAFDLDTGEGKPIPGATRTLATQFRHVVGLYDDALILAGRKLVAIDLAPLKSGGQPRPRWEAPPDSPGRDNTIDGRPALAGNRIFYTGRRTLARGRAPWYAASIDARSGRILEERQIEGSTYGGNIVMSDDAIAIAGDLLTIIFDASEARQRLMAAIEKTPKDAGLHLRLAQIALQEQGFEVAIKGFETARTLAASTGPLGESVHASATLALYNLLMSLAADPAQVVGLPATPKERFERAYAFAATARQRMHVLYAQALWARQAGESGLLRDLAWRLMNEFPDERVQLGAEASALVPDLVPDAEVRAGIVAALMAVASLVEGGNPSEAIALYQHLLSTFGDDPLQVSSGATSVWRHAYTNIGSIIKKHGADAYAAQETAAKALLDEGLKSGDSDAFRTLLDRYPNSSHVEPAWIELSRRLRESGKDRDALRAVQRQIARYGIVTAPLLTELARSLAAAGAYESARDVLLTLKERFGGEGAARMLDAEPYRALIGPVPLPEGTIGAKPSWKATAATSGDEVGLIVPAGRRPGVADSLVLVVQDGELRALELESGRPRWAKPAQSVDDFVRPVWQDGALLALIDGDLVSIDPATGADRWRTPATPGRTLALHAAHGKAYLMVRPPLGGRTIEVRAYDAVTGDKLREADFELAGAPGARPSFASSPLWLLCRLDATTGASVVLDGITGDVAFVQRTGSPALMPAMLSDNNLLITQSASQTRTPREVSIQARNPKTQQVVWNFRLDDVTDRVTLVAATSEVAAFSLRLGGDRPRREIVALDLTKGTTRMVAALRPNDIAGEGTISGDLLLMPFSTATDGKRFVRAYDLNSGAHLWDSVTYSGIGITLAVHPTRNYAIVLARMSVRGAAIDRRSGLLQFIENRTGLLKDSITLENVTSSPGHADLDVRDRALIIKGADGVTVRQ